MSIHANVDCICIEHERLNEHKAHSNRIYTYSKSETKLEWNLLLNQNKFIILKDNDVERHLESI